MDTQFIVDEAGIKKAIILPMEDYEELLENIHDLAIIAEHKDEPSFSFENLKKRLKADGITDIRRKFIRRSDDYRRFML
ncbi:hypothetical protein [Candidatus Magnetomonas plexicatena]|uniref:hypothetical protein n=1 Tax=Candidatus Magnetomonas plexicatena TaxID=2552947 RepID=UPI001C780266|nr:hypothetical protein E2O03_009715 [Nitrospirales bacterium LBB_01]